MSSEKPIRIIKPDEDDFAGFGLALSPVCSGPINPPIFGTDGLFSPSQQRGIHDEPSTPFLDDEGASFADVLFGDEEDFSSAAGVLSTSEPQSAFKPHQLANAAKKDTTSSRSNNRFMVDPNLPPGTMQHKPRPASAAVKTEAPPNTLPLPQPTPFIGNNTFSSGPSSTQQRKRPKVPQATISETAIFKGFHGVEPAKIAEKIRKQRNKEHAKRSRVRKKFLVDSLQQSIDLLEKENQKLRSCLSANLGPEAQSIIHADVTECSSLIAHDFASAKVLEDPDFSLVTALQSAQKSFVITDPALSDNPIVFASPKFLQMTGYTSDQVVGRNCRFLQGPKTNPQAVAKLKKTISNGEDCSVCLINYRADRSIFWNRLFVAPLRDIEGKVSNFIGVLCEISESQGTALEYKEQSLSGSSIV
ncbi:unnamed protein product [Heterosigma akashiwo]|uniref:LOV domain-containing protein n=1 Tax=Heterosigma akashiwo TaxID=2829 RepID=A0A7S4DEM5_HETAK